MTIVDETVEETITPGEPDELSPDTDDDEGEGRSFTFWILAGIGGSIGLCLLLFIVAVGAGSISGRWENVASMVAIIRDLLLIFLVLQAIVIGVAIIVMFVQIAALVNLLQNEIAPIIQNTQQTTQTVRGTAEFMSKRLVKPVIGTTAAIAGLNAFVREISGIQRALHPKGNGATATEKQTTTDSEESVPNETA